MSKLLTALVASAFALTAYAQAPAPAAPAKAPAAAPAAAGSGRGSRGRPRRTGEGSGSREVGRRLEVGELDEEVVVEEEELDEEVHACAEGVRRASPGRRSNGRSSRCGGTLSAAAPGCTIDGFCVQC